MNKLMDILMNPTMNPTMNRILQKLSGCVLALCLSATLWSQAATAGEDWPMWRYDASRSAASPNQLPEKLQLLWERSLGARTQAWDDPLNLDLMTYDRVFEPIVLDGRLFVGFNDQDKLLALDTSSGDVLWSFFAEGPIRLPPVGAAGHVYVCSDDGYLYCLNAATGELKWKFQGAPNAQHAIGNQRLISAWPARGGPVMRDGTLYFAASIWPFMGTFIYALDAQTGQVEWVNSNTGAQYIKQPHSAPSFAGVAPQGALVATEQLLIVPGGRSVPAVLDRRTGDLKYFEINAGGKGTGGSFVVADDFQFFVHTREKGTRAFSLATGLKTAFMPNEPVLHRDIMYSAEVLDGQPVIRAYPANRDEDLAREPLWQIPGDGRRDLILAGNHLVAAGEESLTVFELRTTTALSSEPARLVSHYPITAPVGRLLVADQKLFAVTESGSIMAFGETEGTAAETNIAAEQPVKKQVTENSAVENNITEQNDITEQTAATAQIAKLWHSGDAAGYGLWFGACPPPLLAALVEHNPFAQLAIVTDDNIDQVHAMRQQIDRHGKYGQLTVHQATAANFKAPAYVANMVVVAGPDVSLRDVEAAYGSVRPYGGVLIALNPNNPQALANRIGELELEQAEVTVSELGVSVRRVGALPGSADWTHQYGDVANTIKSDDSRVKLPLGILWFGGSSNMDVLPRHGHGPPEQVVGGRLFIEGMNSLSARDVYTGRVLWKREFEDLGTFDVYYDDTYEDTPLDPKYNQIHIPGANGRGTNYVVTEDRIYLLVGNVCMLLDPATGQDVGEIQLPADPSGETAEWGYIGVYQDVLIGGLGFANYRARHELEVPLDSTLTGSKGGFASKSLDRAASRALVGFDRHSGEQLWRIDATHSFWHNGIVAGGDRVYCLDKNPALIEEAMQRRGLELPDTYRIVALDYRSGQPLWEVKEGVFGTWLGYSAQFDLLLQAGAQASDRLVAEVGQGMAVYRAADGQVEWQQAALKYSGPCILHNEWIITNTNSYSESAGAFDIRTGKQKLIKHPLTGDVQPWKMTRAYGCNNIIASENLLTFRSGAAGYYDLQTDSGTGNLGGFKSGCTSNLVVANGVLNAPDYTRTCSCAYQNQTSLALVHMPDVEVWSVNPMVANTTLPDTPHAPLQLMNLGINFGAPGDRHDPDGTLWIEYPSLTGDEPPLSIRLNPEAKFYQQHSSALGNVELPWVLASGAEGLTELTIALKRHDPEAPPAPSQSPSGEVKTYDVELYFAAPLGDKEARKFNLYAQEQLSIPELLVPPFVSAVDAAAGKSVVVQRLPAVQIIDELRLRFESILGQPVLSGIRIQRVSPLSAEAGKKD